MTAQKKHEEFEFEPMVDIDPDMYDEDTMRMLAAEHDEAEYRRAQKARFAKSRENEEAAKKPRLLSQYNFILDYESRLNYLRWDRSVYFDFETATVEEMMSGDTLPKEMLNIRKTSIVSFSFLIPDEMPNARGTAAVKIWSKNMQATCKKWGIVEDPVEIHGKLWHNLYRYDEEFRIHNQEACYDIFRALEVAARRGSGKGGAGQITIAGYNNRKFDNLLFAGDVDEDGLAWRLYLDGKKANLSLYDIRLWSDSFGFSDSSEFGLRGVGKWVGHHKMDRKDIVSPETYKQYNDQDTRIVLEFLYNLNRIHAELETPEMDLFSAASGARAYVAKRMRARLKKEFNFAVAPKFLVSQVADTKYMYNYGGRTEAFTAVVNEPVFGFDANSMYAAVQKLMYFPKIMPNKRGILAIESETINSWVQVGGQKLYDSKIILAKKTLEDRIRPVWDSVAGCRHFVHPLEMVERMNELFKSGLLPFGTFFVQIKGVRKEYKTKSETILRYFPLPIKSGSHTMFAHGPEETYQVSFYDLAYLPLFDYDFVGIGKIYTPDYYVIRDVVDNLYQERREHKNAIKKAERLALEGVPCDIDVEYHKTMEMYIKRILNSGYGILCTKNRKSKRSAVYSDAGKMRILDAAAAVEDAKERYEADPEDVFNEYDYKKLEAVWSSAGKIKEFFINASRGRRLRVHVSSSPSGSNSYTVHDIDDTRQYSSNTIPIYGIAITSGARFVLNCILISCGLQMITLGDGTAAGPVVHYTDTDSIYGNDVLDQLMVKHNIVGDGLGYFKREHYDTKTDTTELSSAVFMAPKSYVLVYKPAPDGRSRGAIIKKLKGTGDTFVRDVVVNSLRGEFQVQTREAVNPDVPQKRTLRGNVYHPVVEAEMGTDEFRDVVQKVKLKYDDDYADRHGYTQEMRDAIEIRPAKPV